jgi:cation diffusion facilitator CzcD-associated flavoprotein CzcO
MTQAQTMATADRTAALSHYDAIIIGAGVTGLYQLYSLRKLGISVHVFEKGSGVGGTWYWNRYPGARFDSESYTYGYSWSEEVLQEWNWTEHFSPQPETLRYLNFVADKFDLKKDITFNASVKSAHWNEAADRWDIETENGERASARFLITAIGILHAANMPKIPGIEDFEGQSWHTSQWPRDANGWGSMDVGLNGKRIGVIGTGATAVQLIQELAKVAGDLTVFQLLPEYCAPLGNSKIDDEWQQQIKARYPEIFKTCRETFAGFEHVPDPRSALDVPAEEREAFWEKLYGEPGFGIWLGNYSDILTNQQANDLITDFIRKKIRERVKDPKVAEKLVPKTYGFGLRRVPMETHYYEVYNQDNVHLVDLTETPIQRITKTGVKTSDKEFEFDFIIYATGFDAVTGSFTRMDIRGEGGQTLKDKWENGPRTYLGLQTVGFPNMFTLVGPHNGATFCNMPRCAEQNVEWVTECVRYLTENGIERIEPKPDAEQAWTDHVNEIVQNTLLPTVDSWFMGTNVEGKKKNFLMYTGGSPAYRAKCDEVAAQGYEGFDLR